MLGVASQPAPSVVAMKPRCFACLSWHHAIRTFFFLNKDLFVGET